MFYVPGFSFGSGWGEWYVPLTAFLGLAFAILGLVASATAGAHIRDERTPERNRHTTEKRHFWAGRLPYHYHR